MRAIPQIFFSLVLVSIGYLLGNHFPMMDATQAEPKEILGDNTSSPESSTPAPIPEKIHNEIIVDKPRIVAASSSSVSSARLEQVGATDNARELASLREYRMQTEIKKLNDAVQARGGYSPESLSDSFKREPIDPAWAKDKETLINNLVEKHESLAQIPHMASECRSKQCKISVLSDDQFYLHNLSASLDKIVAEHEASFSSYMTIVDEKTHTTSIYFDRNQ